jgi:protein-tyrosine phosphatase
MTPISEQHHRRTHASGGPIVTPPADSPARTILVVCLGNHCRSPLAAAILTHRGGNVVDVRSAGLHPSRHVGRPAHPLMIRAAGALGYDLTDHRGVALTPELLAWADTILAMDQAVFDQLQHRATPADRSKIRTYLPGADVPDPWGQEAAEFAACAALIDLGAARHVA